MVGHPTRPQAAQIAIRRDEAIKMRLAGVDYLTIGRALAADPQINSRGQAFPAGYGIDGYLKGEPPPNDKTLANLAKQDLFRVLRTRRGKVEEGAEALRALQDERLNRLLSAVWSGALKGDEKAVANALKIMERQAKLRGLDSPVRTELTGADGGAVQISGVSDEERSAAVLSILAFRDDRDEAKGALEAARDAGGEVDEDVISGVGADLLDDDEEDEEDGRAFARRVLTAEPVDGGVIEGELA